MKNSVTVVMGMALLAFELAGCEPAAPTAEVPARAGKALVGAVPTPALLPTASLPVVVVSKNASCTCCNAWVKHLRMAGFTVEVRDIDNLDPIKTQVGVPVGKGSCHTAQVGGYFIEGHVPASDIKRLLTEKSQAKGLVLPGMPLGAPGMELPDGTTPPYTVELAASDGTTRVFARHGQ